MKKKDLLLIAAVLLAAGLLFLLTRSGADPGCRVDIYLDDVLYQSIRAGEETTVIIEREGKKNIILFEKDGVSMHSSSCKNQVCVNTGKLFYDDALMLELNRWIVCLPNGVSLEVVSE